MKPNSGTPPDGTLAESRAWADDLCRRLAEPWRAFEFWDARHQRALRVNFWNVRRETGYTMEHIVMQREKYFRRILNVDLSGEG